MQVAVYQECLLQSICFVGKDCNIHVGIEKNVVKNIRYHSRGLTRLSWHLTDSKTIVVNCVYNIFLEVIHLKRNKSFIKRYNFDIILDEVYGIFHTLLIFKNLFLCPLYRNIRFFSSGFPR